MLEPNAVVRIRGTQNYQGREPEVIELTTEGTLYEKDGVLHLSYAESELTGLEGTWTTFVLRDDQIRLTREGKLNSEMVFVVGRTEESLYDTGMGALLVTIRTLSIDNQMTVQGGLLYVTYKIAIENFGSGQIEYRLIANRI